MKPFEQATTEELRALWEEKYPQKIVPAEPLTEPPNIGERYYTVWEGECSSSVWHDDDVDPSRLRDKNVFPFTPQGKAGAELRAKVPHPGIHWQEDLKKLRDARSKWLSAPITDKNADSIFSIATHNFIHKYLTE